MAKVSPAPQAKAANNNAAKQQANVAGALAAAKANITTLQGQVLSNGAFLETLVQVGPPAKIGSNSAVGAGSATAFSGAQATYLNAFASTFNLLLSYVNQMASDLNSLYDALQDTNIIS